MGIILLHKRMFVGLIFFGLPLFIVLIGVIIDIISFESKCQDVRLDKDFMREQVFLVLLKKISANAWRTSLQILLARTLLRKLKEPWSIK
jgi:uncharacterized membrane protein